MNRPVQPLVPHRSGPGLVPPGPPQRRVGAVGGDQLVVGADLGDRRPSSTTATRSASCAVCSRCAIATTVRPSSTAASERSRCRAARGSSSEVASSSTSVCGSASTSRASASCCACAGGQHVRRRCRPRCPARRAARRPTPARRPHARAVEQLRPGRRPDGRAAGCPRASRRTRGAPASPARRAPRSSSSVEVDELHPADRRPGPCGGRGCRRSAGRASTCPPRDGPTTASRSPGRGRGTRRAARRDPRGRRTARRSTSSWSSTGVCAGGGPVRRARAPPR